MPEGKSFEYQPGETTEASEVSKQEFLGHVVELVGGEPEPLKLSVLTAPTVERNYRMQGDRIDIVYISISDFSPEELAEMPEESRKEVNARAAVHIGHMIDATHEQLRSFVLGHDGSMDVYRHIFDRRRLKERRKLEKEARHSGDKEILERLAGEAAREALGAAKFYAEQEKVGITKATEADVKEINTLLTRLIERERKKKDKKS